MRSLISLGGHRGRRRRCARRQSLLGFIGLSPERAFDRDALIDQIRLHPKLPGKPGMILLHRVGNRVAGVLVLDGRAEPQIEGDIGGNFL